MFLLTVLYRELPETEVRALALNGVFDILREHGKQVFDEDGICRQMPQWDLFHFLELIQDTWRMVFNGVSNQACRTLCTSTWIHKLTNLHTAHKQLSELSRELLAQMKVREKCVSGFSGFR